MAYLSPKSVITEHLRKHIDDPRTDRDYFVKEESFTGDGSTKEFSLTPDSGSVSYIVSVKIDSVTKVKWRDYYLDFKREKIVFITDIAPSDGSSIVINYIYSTKDWIYPDKPKKKLSAEQFPRMNVGISSMTGNRLGNYKAPIESRVTFQVDVWVKQNQIFTIDGIKFAGDSLAEYLSYQVLKEIEDNMAELQPYMYHYQLTKGPTELPFNYEYMSYHYMVEFQLSIINPGRI